MLKDKKAQYFRQQVVPAILFALDIITGKVANKTKRLNLKHFACSRIPDLVQALLALTVSGLANGKVTQLIDHYKVSVPKNGHLVCCIIHIEIYSEDVYRVRSILKI